MFQADYNANLGQFPDPVLVAGGVTGGGAGGAGGILAAAGGPIGLAIFGVTTALGLFLRRQRPAQKRQSSIIADEVERHMVANRDAYLNEPRRNCAMQTQALANFDQAWAYLVENCRPLGEPGQNCITERQAGGQWDWFAAYRAPIEQDSCVSEGVFSSLLPGDGAGIRLSDLVIPAGLVAAALWL